MKRVLLCLLPIVLLLVSCRWSTPSTTREEPVPAAREADRLRATEPPASAEVRELRTQELAAETALAGNASDETGTTQPWPTLPEPRPRRGRRGAARLAPARTAAHEIEARGRGFILRAALRDVLLGEIIRPQGVSRAGPLF